MISINDWSSDHTPVNFCVSQQGPQPPFSLPIQIMTWNKLNQCHSKLTCKATPHPYSNNPWDIDESDQQYADRVKQQREYLIQTIIDKDVICLQEVNDLLFPQTPNIQQINSVFENDLDRIGYGMIKSRKIDNTRHLVTLYNKNRLKYLNQRGVLPSEKGKNSGLEIEFKDKTTGLSYAATNIHLEWNEDYRQVILDYQIEQIARGIMTTISGDTNHPADIEQFSFAGNRDYPTTIDVDAHQYILRHCDSLAASPAKGHSVRIVERGGKYFAPHDQGFIVKDFTSHGVLATHESKLSKPWVCKKYLAAASPLPSFKTPHQCKLFAIAIKDRITHGVLQAYIFITENNESIHFELKHMDDDESFKAMLDKLKIHYVEGEFLNNLGNKVNGFIVKKLDAIPLMTEARII